MDTKAIFGISLSFVFLTPLVGATRGADTGIFFK